VEVVEAAGVEPASENVAGKEPTYLVEFTFPDCSGISPHALRTDKKRDQLVCGSRLSHPDVTAKASPLCDVLRQPASKAAENGYLIN